MANENVLQNEAIKDFDFEAMEDLISQQLEDQIADLEVEKQLNRQEKINASFRKELSLRKNLENGYMENNDISRERALDHISNHHKLLSNDSLPPDDD